VAESRINNVPQQKAKAESGRAGEGSRAGDERHVIEHFLPIWHKPGKALISRTAVGGAPAALSASGTNAPLEPVPAINCNDLRRRAAGGMGK
jgi:hypothetical protein